MKAFILFTSPLILAGLVYLAVPFCLKTMSLTSSEDIVESAVAEAASHSRIATPFENFDAVKDFIQANPDCCRILDRDDPFYASGSLDQLFGRTTKIVEVRMFAASLEREYTLYLWVNRCGQVVEYTGI